MRIITKGATSKSIYVVILDSASTTGGRKTGIVYNAAGLTAYYTLNGAAAVAITLATLAAASSAYSSGGFKEVDATNAPGLYRVDLPNAALTGADSVVVTIKGASGMVQVDEEIQLTGVDFMDAVRAGMTALPNANAEAAGGLFTRGTGAGQINQANNGQIDANAARTGGTTNTGRDIGASVLLSTGTGTGQLDFTSGVVKANLAQILGTALTETAGLIAAGFKQFFNIASPTSTMNTITTVTTATNLTNAPTAGDLTATMKTSVTTAATAATPALSAAGVQAIWDALASALTTVGSVGKRIADFLTGDAYARMGAPAGASVSADIAAAKVDTAAIKAKTDSLTFTVAGMADANVVDWKGATAPAMTGDAYARLGAPAGASIAADIATRLPTSSYTAPLSAAATANAVWDEATAGHGTAGTTGKALTNAGAGGTPLDAAGVRAAVGLASANLDTQLAATAQDSTVAKDATVAKASAISALNNISAAQVRTEAKGAIADYGGIL